MTTLTVTRGLPGSGKSTWTRERLAAAVPGTAVNVNRDLVGHMLHGSRPHLPKTESQITTAHHATVESNLRRSVDVIVDDTNLKAANLRKLCEIAWRCGADVEVVDFDIPVDQCIARDAERAQPAGEEVIRNMARRYLTKKGFPPIPTRPDVPKGLPYVPDLTRHPTVIVDIDGTVALHATRDPYDTSRYHEDVPNQPIVDAVRALHATGYHIVYCSGRHEDFRAVTDAWLSRHVGVSGRLFMRPGPGSDDMVKLKLFDDYIRHNFNVRFVIDDRDRVVKMWRSLGLTVLQCAEGNF